MPPKKRKKEAPYVCKRTCDVKKCRSKIVCIWGNFPDIEKGNHFGVCGKHSDKHRDKKDKFSLYKEFGISRRGTTGSVDRFGIAMARDHDEMIKMLSISEKKDNSESIQRLQDWKERNKGKEKKKKFKPTGIKARKPRETLATMKTKELSNNDMDDVLTGILDG